MKAKIAAFAATPAEAVAIQSTMSVSTAPGSARHAPELQLKLRQLQLQLPQLQ